MSRRILGFDRGFDYVKLYRTPSDRTGETDRKIADLVVKRLASPSTHKQRFFGWIFFVSPHARYQAHYKERPASTALDRYRQELQFVDEQVGRVKKALEDTGLIENTIVIFTGDHGEEFEEHGGKRHKTTVYNESIQVPLLVHIPRMRGQPLDGRTSVYYIFPWLMLSGTPYMRGSARDRLESELGPMLRRTEGAVVTELNGWDRMRSALIYDQYKVMYDFGADFYEIFDLIKDPGEKKNLYETDADLRKTFTSLVGEYKKVRAATGRFETFSKRTGRVRTKPPADRDTDSAEGSED